MATSYSKTIGQVAGILDRPEIDRKGRHIILEVLTKVLGENVKLQNSLDKKNQELCDLRVDNTGYADQAEMDERAIESFKDRLMKKDEEILKLMENLRVCKDLCIAAGHTVTSLEDMMMNEMSRLCFQFVLSIVRGLFGICSLIRQTTIAKQIPP